MRSIGDVQVSAVGFGCMPMSSAGMADHCERAVETIHAALDRGITLLDTANIYAPAWDAVGHNEALVAEAIRRYTGPATLTDVLVITKGGITRSGGEIWGRASRPDELARACEESLIELGGDVIDLYQHHRHDPNLTYLQQMQAMRIFELVAVPWLCHLS